MHDGAEADLREALAYYEEQRAGLGGELRREFELALRRIRENPLACAAEAKSGVRHCALHRFPYAIVYRNRDAEVSVVAMMHHRRRPRYWKKRLSD